MLTSINLESERLKSFEAKVSKLQSSLAERNLDGMVCFRPQNTFYLTGFNPILYSHPVVVVLPVKGKPVLLVHCLRADHARAEAITDDVRLFGAWGRQKPIASDPYDAIKLILNDLGISGKRIGYEADYLSIGKYEKLKAVSNASSLEDIGNLMKNARMVKDSYEIAMIRNAARLADAGMEAAIANIRASEIEASSAAEIAMRKLWASEFSEYEVASFGGDEGGIVNALWCYSNSGKRVAHGCDAPSARIPQPGETALPIVWAACAGYHAENERTVIIEELNDEYSRAYDAMLEAYNRGLKAIKPGVTFSQVYEESVSAFREAGFGNTLPGRIGHGMGLSLHEAPSIGPDVSIVLEKGMVLTMEPGLVFPDWGSVRHSDTVVVTENGVELLTISPKADKIIR